MLFRQVECHTGMQKRKRHGEAASVRERKRHNKIASESFFQLQGGMLGDGTANGLQTKVRFDATCISRTILRTGCGVGLTEPPIDSPTGRRVRPSDAGTGAGGTR